MVDRIDYVCARCGAEYWNGEVDREYALACAWHCQCGATAESLEEVPDEFQHDYLESAGLSELEG